MKRSAYATFLLAFLPVAGWIVSCGGKTVNNFYVVNSPDNLWRASLERSATAGVFQFNLSHAGDRETLPCQIDLGLEHGRRLRCDTAESPDLYLAKVMFRDDTQRGVGVLETDEIVYLECAMGEGKALLSCVENNANTRAENIFGRTGWVSLFPSSVAGLNLPNTHDFGPGSVVYRGSRPSLAPDFEQLTQVVGIKSYLIFANLPAKTLQAETNQLIAHGVAAADIHNIPFDWEKYPNFAAPCAQIVEALALLAAAEKSAQTIFFHCELGEDRTGVLAGLYRILSQGWTIGRAFTEEMCEDGYSGANPVKSLSYYNTVVAVDRDETPLYLKLAYKIARGELTMDRLDAAVCDTDPADDPQFASSFIYNAANFKCGFSTRFWPYDEDYVAYE